MKIWFKTAVLVGLSVGLFAPDGPPDGRHYMMIKVESPTPPFSPSPLFLSLPFPLPSPPFLPFLFTLTPFASSPFLFLSLPSPFPSSNSLHASTLPSLPFPSFLSFPFPVLHFSTISHPSTSLPSFPPIFLQQWRYRHAAGIAVAQR